MPHKGEDEYRFSDGAVIRTLLIDTKLRKALSVGVLVIVAQPILQIMENENKR